jgi:hypothetical protein
VSTVEQILAGKLADAAQGAVANSGDAWVAGLAEKGQAFIATLEDDGIKAGLSAALGVLTTPAATETLKKAAAHQITGFAIKLGAGQRGEARAIFIAESDFATRHRLIASDNAALVQSTDEHVAFVNSLESLLLEATVKGGTAFLPFLLSVL